LPNIHNFDPDLNQPQCDEKSSPYHQSCLLAWLFVAYSQQLDIKQAGDNFAISIKCQDQAAINPPAEGLWSIATSWQDDWPASWQHATPSQVAGIRGLENPIGYHEAP
jgi:hypothetical protein